MKVSSPPDGDMEVSARYWIIEPVTFNKYAAMQIEYLDTSDHNMHPQRCELRSLKIRLSGFVGKCFPELLIS